MSVFELSKEVEASGRLVPVTRQASGRAKISVPGFFGSLRQVHRGLSSASREIVSRAGMLAGLASGCRLQTSVRRTNSAREYLEILVPPRPMPH